MYSFHENKDRYFGMQKWVTKEYVIPYLKEIVQIDESSDVLEVGCAEAGVLAAFLEEGANGVGIELLESRASTARNNLQEAINKGKARIVCSNIYDVDPNKEEGMKFDVIVLKDVIEHIPNQEKFIPFLRGFLKPEGVIFFGYPPWWMPFGGHQQICQSKVLSKLPWFHLLPMGLYKAVLKAFGETKERIVGLEEIKDTGITIERMHRILKKEGYQIIKQTHWLINPIYVKKFRFKPLKSLINIPYLRNFYVTCHYVVFK